MNKPNKPRLAWICLALLCAAVPLQSAEPVADPNELPRIPPTEPADALKTFKVKKGFKLELVAAEPLVTDPVSMSFDANGRLYVVEMRGYSERREDSMGQIRLLEDTDYDGRMDKSTIFARDLNWPTAVFCYDGGVFIGVTPDLWFMKDTDGDGVADLKKVVFTGFGSSRDRLNVQAMFNSFRWGLDNRIHGATAGNGGVVSDPASKDAKPLSVRGRDFSFDPRTMELRAIGSTAQHGMSFDNWGRKFICSNSSHLQTLMYDTKYAGRNPHYSMPSPRISAAADGAAAEVYRLSPDEPWRIVRTRWRATGAVRGVVEGGGRVSGYFTAATGVTIYRGGAYGEDFLGNAFIGDAGSNLIHRKKIRYQGVQPVGERPADEQKVEFIASSDNWFRPVQFANAPDGCLYVADMYRETIEHPWSIPEAIKKHVDLNSGNDRGRIYRIVPDGFKQPKAPKMKTAPTSELVAALAHSNGWQRDTAARLLFERQDKSVVPQLKALAQKSSSAVGRMHALHALKGINLPSQALTERALGDPHPRVRQSALRLIEAMAESKKSINWAPVGRMVNDPDPRVRFQLAFTLGAGDFPGKSEALARLALKDGGDKWVQAALMSSAGNRIGDLFRELAASRKSSQSASGQVFLTQLSEVIGRRKNAAELNIVTTYLEDSPPGPLAFNIVRALNSGLVRSRSSLAGAKLDGRLAPTFERARKLAIDSQARESDRLAAIRLLATPGKNNDSHLLMILDRADSEAVSLEAIRSSTAHASPALAKSIVKSFPGYTPRLKTEAVKTLLARTERARLLLEAVGLGSIRISDLSATDVQKLRGHRDKTTKKLAADVLGAPPSKNRQSVVDSFLPAMRLKGSAAKGKLVYQKLCVSCHKIGAEGHAIGPDLVTMKSMGREKILVNILDPNREVAPQYFGYSIDAKDGENYSGLIASEDDATVTLKAAFGVLTQLGRSDIASMKSTGISIMPEGLEAGLPHQDMADLIEFIVTADAK